jgi:TIR domain-containing protein
MMATKLFISYRRDDSAGHAGRVHDRLEREFGRDLLFMDVDAIPLGSNFVKVLGEEVAKCDVLLAVIGPNWLNARDEDGNRRLDNPHDFVRIEIGAALQRNIPVIPILLDGTKVPKANQLPEELEELSLRNGLDIRHVSFHNDVDRLIRSLKVQLAKANAEKRRGDEDERRRQEAEFKQRADEEKRRRKAEAWERRRSIAPGRWRMAAGSAIALLLAGWIGVYQMGVPVWVPWTPRAEQPDAPGADKAKAAAEAEARANPPDGPRLAAIDPGKPPSPPSPSSEEQRAWDRIKDSSNQAALRDFIRRYPSSVLANTAQTRLQALERAAQEQAAEEARQKAEREAKARAEREAKAAEEARQKAEREAAVRRAEEEAAEAERKRLAQEAARKRAEEAEAQRAWDRIKDSSNQAALRDFITRYPSSVLANTAQTRLQALERAAQEQAAEEARQKAEREAAIKRAEEERLAKQAEEEPERQKAERERLAALQRTEEERVRKQQEETERCRREADRLAELRSTKDQSKAREGLKRLQEELTCERLRPGVTAALEKIEKPEPVGPSRHRQRAKPEESGKSAARHRNEEAKPSRKESRPQPRVREEARTAPVRRSGGGGGGGVLGVGF